MKLVREYSDACKPMPSINALTILVVNVNSALWWPEIVIFIFTLCEVGFEFEKMSRIDVRLLLES